LLPRFGLDVGNFVKDCVGEGDSTEGIGPISTSDVDTCSVDGGDVLVVDVCILYYLPT
jgi:hypothetical protein